MKRSFFLAFVFGGIVIASPALAAEPDAPVKATSAGPVRRLKIAVDGRREGGATEDAIRSNAYAAQTARDVDAAKIEQAGAAAHLPAARRETANAERARANAHAVVRDLEDHYFFAELPPARKQLRVETKRVAAAQRHEDQIRAVAAGANVKASEERHATALGVQSRAEARMQYAQARAAASKNGDPTPSKPHDLATRRDVTTQLRALSSAIRTR